MEEASIFKPPIKPIPNRLNAYPALSSGAGSEKFSPNSSPLPQDDSFKPASLARFGRKGDAFHSHSASHIYFPSEANGSGLSNLNGDFGQGQFGSQGIMERSISGPFDGTAQNINSLDGSSHSYESLTIAEDLKMQADVDDFVKSLVQEQFDVPAQEDATCNPSSARTSFFPTLDQFLVPFLEGEGNSNN